MLSVEEARAIILGAVRPKGTEGLWFAETLGRVLAEDLIAQTSIPPFSQSAMDGFAVRAIDTENAKADRPTSLTILGTLAAGHLAPWVLTPGTAVRIMTGAPLPEGADAVVKREDTDFTAEAVRIFHPVRANEYIIPPGRDIPRGAHLLRRGELITPAAIGLFASIGQTEVRVFERPRVALLALGDELVPPEAPLAPGQIRVSNLFALAASVTKYGGQAVNLGIAPDRLDAIRSALVQAGEADLLVTLGGSQRGDFDLVDDLLGGPQSALVFRDIAVNYAGSMLFGRFGQVPFCGLPGSPMAAFVAFEALVRPAIWALAGRRALDLPRVEALLLEPLPATTARALFYPVWVETRPEGVTAVPLRIEKAPDLPPQTLANGLIYRPPGSRPCQAGERVWVDLLEPVAGGHGSDAVRERTSHRWPMPTGASHAEASGG
jgi:molybdopterin molybdotransferase